MNDLERDLKDLFETKASDVQTTPLAPPAVLRRGRRRQVGTVVGGALMAITAAAVVVGGASAFLADRASDPPMGDPDALPARTATIGGVTVAAPGGWSLLDQSLWSMAIATETCTSTFEGPATPVGPGVPEGDADPVETPPVVEEECTPVELPGGVPLFTLANVEPNPIQTVCDVIPEMAVQSVGPTDAYLYVALRPDPTTQQTWPVPLDTGPPGSCGTNLTAEWTVGDVGYFAAAAFGSEVSDADRQAVLDAFAGLGFEGSPLQMTESPVIGFVMAAGVQDDVPWRLEAGPSLTCESGEACAVQLALVTTDPDGAEQAWPVTPPTSGSSIESGSQPVGRATIAFGAAAADVEAVQIVTGDGTTVTPTSVPWPSTLEAFASPEAPVAGTIWWATVPDVDTVNAVLADGTTTTPSDVDVKPLEDLRLDTREEGGYQVASGEDLGSRWTMRWGPEGFLSTVGDQEETGITLGNGSYAIHEVPGGAVLHYQLAPSDGPVIVTVDGAGTTSVGRWMPTEDAYGEDGRMWVVFLPGSGSGSLEGVDGFPAQDISWPPIP